MSVKNHDSIFRILDIDHSQFLEPPPQYFTRQIPDTHLLCYENGPLVNQNDSFPINDGNNFLRRYCPFYNRYIWTHIKNSMENHRTDFSPCVNGCCMAEDDRYSTSSMEFLPKREFHLANLRNETVSNGNVDQDLLNTTISLSKKHLNSSNIYSDDILNIRIPSTNKHIQDKSVNIIKNFLLGVKNKKIFKELKSTIRTLSNKDPIKLLMIVNYIHALIFDKNTCVLIFRLDGTCFPPKIVYKLFTNQKILILEPHKYITARKAEIKRRSLFNWFPFNVYKCDICKSTVQIRPKTSKKPKKKWRENNHITWIEKIYGD